MKTHMGVVEKKIEDVEKGRTKNFSKEFEGIKRNN